MRKTPTWAAWSTALLSGLAILAADVGDCPGQCWSRACCPSPYSPVPWQPSPAPSPAPTQTPAPTAGQPPAASAQPGTPATTPAAEPSTTPQAANEPTLSPERFGAVGGESVALAAPNMIGDFIGVRVMRCVPVTTQQTILVPTQVGTMLVFPPGSEVPVVVPIIRNLPQTVSTTTVVCQEVFEATRGAFRIGENESPRPEDRVFVTYNNYADVPGGLDATGAVTRGAVNREVFGFEKTFLDGNGSVGLRAPVLQQEGDGGFSGNDFGDLSLVTKYAFLYDRQSGNLASGGLVVTAPTGPGLLVLQGERIHSTLFQPWLGFIRNFGDFYLEGFSSVVVPTDARDVTLAFNDLAVGYRLYRRNTGLVRSVIPTLETHVTTPLDHRGPDALVGMPDLVDLTAGAHLGLPWQSVLTLGVNTPVTGPRPYGVEAIVQFNYRF
jgi:hypothetical protein